MAKFKAHTAYTDQFIISDCLTRQWISYCAIFMSSGRTSFVFQGRYISIEDFYVVPTFI